MFQVIEKYLLGKSKIENSCEDGLFINNHFIAVIDGVTSKGKQLWHSYTSGAYAKEILLRTLSHMPYDITAIEMITRLNESLYHTYKKDIVHNHKVEWLRAGIILYSDYHKEIWSFGDCQCYINDTLYTHSKQIDYLTATMRSLAIHSALKNGATLDSIQKDDIGRKAILPFLKMQLDFENTNDEFGYPVLNGHDINLDQVSIYSVNPNDQIIFATDGYPTLYTNLTESELALNEILSKDPLCFSLYQSTKGVTKDNLSYDDRCYIRFKIQ